MAAEGESNLIVGSGEEVNVNIRCSNGSKFSVRTRLESTVQEFKAVLAQSCDVPAEQQRLIYKGRILKDEQTLVSYGMLHYYYFWWVSNFVSYVNVIMAHFIKRIGLETLEDYE